jgi:transcriptional regulator with XRE-family HTH domain
LGRSHGLISRWEHGLREPTLFDLDRLATVLRADLDALVADLPPTPTRRGCSSRAHPISQRVAVGQTLELLRIRSRLDRWEVHKATGIDPRQIRRIESGADPAIGEAVLLIALYRSTPSAVLAAAKIRRRRNLDND